MFLMQKYCNNIDLNIKETKKGHNVLKSILQKIGKAKFSLKIYLKMRLTDLAINNLCNAL